MVFLIILGLLLAMIVLVCQIPVGFDVGYEQGQAHVSAKAMGLLLQLYPKPPPDPKAKPKKEKPKKEKPKEASKEKKPRKMPSFNFTKDEILELVKAVFTSVGRFGRSLEVDRFVLHITVAGNDPYDTAMLYGWLNAALSTLAPIAERSFKSRNVDVWTAVDFDNEKPRVDAALAMSIRIGQILGVAFSLASRALVILLRNKRRLRREARLNPPPTEAENTAPAAEPPAENTITDQNTGTEERTERNGNGE